jgi:hypothetical protein
MDETQGLLLAGPQVVLDGVDPHLISFVQHLAAIHLVIFGSDLVLTSGKDSIHSPGSLHAQGRAVDVRIRDLSPDSQLLFLSIVAYAAPLNNIAVFDERALGAESHVHLEYHG